MKSKDSNDSKSQPSAPGSADIKPKGQKRSAERGSATNNKKDPGKRAKQGGN